MIEKSNGIWVALALTLVASIWTAKQESPVDDMVVVQPKIKRHALAVNTSSSVIDSLANERIVIQRTEIDGISQNIFTSFVDESSLVAVSVALQPEPPPVNPFIYVGKIVDEGNVMVFLTEGSNNYSVKAGDYIDDVWQVLAIAPPLITIQYVPRKIKMQMQIGVAS